jgi:hypothetical protein
MAFLLFLVPQDFRPGIAIRVQEIRAVESFSGRYTLNRVMRLRLECDATAGFFVPDVLRGLHLSKL